MIDNKVLSMAIAEQVAIAAPKAKVWPFWVLNADLSSWPAVMRSEADQGRAHGWCITRRMALVEEQMSNHVLIRPTYYLWGVHYRFQDQIEGNTDWIFNDEIDGLISQFAKNLNPLINTTEGLQVDLIGLRNTGAELVHIAQARLELEIC